MNNLPPRESEPVYRSNKKNSLVNWDSDLKAESFLGSGSIWCWKTSGGWGLYVRNSTQRARRNAALSSHGFTSLCEKMRRSADASLTWTRFHVLLLGEGRPELRFEPSCFSRSWQLGCKGDGFLAHQREMPCCKDCPLFNSFRFWGAGLFSQMLWWLLRNLLLFSAELSDESIWSSGLPSTASQTRASFHTKKTINFF